MTTYKDSGVNVEQGDKASANAYSKASETFASRKGMIGEPLLEEGGYAGLLDMGEYYLIHTTDGTGTKIDLAYEVGLLNTLGYDLLAMVADDAVCTGAEVISVSNCIDTATVNPAEIDALMSGLAKACSEQKIVIPAGEIAEVPQAVTRSVWSAAALGVVEKDKVIDTSNAREGDAILSFQSNVARSNGFSLIRAALHKNLGDNWHSQEWKDGTSWGEIMLAPSVIYHSAVLGLIGRFGKERLIQPKGIAHITGGGIPSKLRRVLKKSGLGAKLHTLWPAHSALFDLIELAHIDVEEAYKTWNMGNGMMMIVDEKDCQTVIDHMKTHSIQAQIAGYVTADSSIEIETPQGENLRFN